MIECLIFGNKYGKYTENVRSFCLKRHFHSNAAYESLRLFFNKNIPSKRTLQIWYTSVDGSPGINLSSLDILKEKAILYKSENHHQLHVTLISDEMSIRKDISWSAEKQSFVGFVSVISSSGRNTEDDNQNKLDVAKNALVFLVVGPDFKVPVAYHLLNKLDSHERAELTREIIKSIEQIGIRILSLTFDGLYANLSTAELLGAKFDEKKPFFPSPTYPNQNIFIIFDPPHMLKLVRKHFSKEAIYSQDKLLDWNLLKILVEKQRGENFNLCNKLTQHHIDWHHKPMNVKLAAETISRSVADAIEQLDIDGYEEFENTKSTVEFLRNFNDIFDVLNVAEKSQTDITDITLKQPLSERTVEKIFSFADQMLTYIEKLIIDEETKDRVVRKPIFKSGARMGFLGFYMDLISLKGIYNDFVKNGPLSVFYTKIFSQDHLETFFSLIRNRQGRNDNPNAVEFQSAFKKLLICHPLMTSENHNVISNATGLLTVSSRPKRQLTPTDSIEIREIDVNKEELYNRAIDPTDPYQKHLSSYIAVCVEEKILQANKRLKKSSCRECTRVLLDNNEKINDELLSLKNKSQPCKSTLKIVIFSEAVLELISSNEGQISFDVASKTINDNLNLEEY